MPADLLLFILIAAGLVFWLRSILGERKDDDLPSKLPKLLDNGDAMPEKTNVVSLNAKLGDEYVLPLYVRIDNKTTENALNDISTEYDNFDLENFVQGAEGAFPMIVESFADGDLETLEGLLAPEVYKAFENVVKERETTGEKVETEIKAVEKIDITDAQIKDEHLFITVRFSAREVCVIRDKNDDIISGDPDKTTVMVDVWVFGRSLESNSPEWYLYETRDDEVEDHKTPIPEGGSDKEKK